MTRHADNPLVQVEYKFPSSATHSMSEIFVFVLFLSFTFAAGEYTVPVPTFEALKSGEIRVYIPAPPETTFFAINANLNSDISDADPGDISEETRTRTGDFFVLTFNNPVATGNVIHYWIYVSANGVGHKHHGTWKVLELQELFTPLPKSSCTIGSTVQNGKKTCIGTLIFEDTFDEQKLNKTNWIVEHKIPTYTGPNFEFNSYKNIDATRFTKDGILYLKPIALQDENEVRGTIDITNDCTSKNPDECYYAQVYSFLLPPVKSAKITSKFSFKYGKISVRAKLPFGDWIYPIMELEHKQKRDAENSPKVWIAYSRGNDYLTGAHGEDDIGSRLLFGGPILHATEPERSNLLTSSRNGTARFSDDFHVYTVLWKPGNMIFYVDSMEYGNINLTQHFHDPPIDVRSRSSFRAYDPFDDEYVVSFGVAVGGINDFPDGYNSTNDPKPWLNGERNYIKKFFDARNVWSSTWQGDRPALQVDYVKIWAV